MAKKKQELTVEEKLAAALVREDEWPYGVPGNWVWVRLGSVARWGSGGTPSRRNPNFYSGHIPWIKTGELENSYIYDTAEKITDEAIKKSSAKLFPINTIVIAMYGATIGKVGIMGVEATTNQACACGISSAALNYLYLFYFALSQKDDFIKAGKGGAQPNISQEIIKAHKFPLPPLAEQQRIVDRIESLFDQLDQAKALIQEALDSFATRKAAILHQAFTGALTKKWREEHGVGLESWQEKPLKDISVIISGNAFKSQDFNASYEVPCVKITNVGVGYFRANDDDDDRLPESYIHEYNRFLVKSDDILISLTRSFINKGLKVCIYPKEEAALLNQRVAIIRYNCTNYLYYYLRTEAVLNFIKEKSKTTNQPNLSINDLKNLFIPVPSSNEQHEIVRILDDLLAKEQNAQDLCDLIDQIEGIKKTILGKAFRGELGTNAAGEASARALLQQLLSPPDQAN